MKLNTHCAALNSLSVMSYLGKNKFENLPTSYTL